MSEPASLFDDAAARNAAAAAPLAVRMRPRSLDEVVGQDAVLGPGRPLRRLVDADEGMSVILYGPPGTGKTSLAHVVSLATKRTFVQLSALNSGVKDVRAVIDTATRELGLTGRRTVLFIDEVHRFSKTQQDSLLSAVENRVVSLIAATTENPYFSIVSPLLSRSIVLRLEPLCEQDVRVLIRRALTDTRGYGGTLTMSADAEDHTVRIGGGDARRALTTLEAAANAARDEGLSEISLPVVEAAVTQAAVHYDRDGDQHFDVASALIKSIRGSDVDAALHYLARMVEAGEDPRFLARRLVISASEDIGMADPSALPLAVAAYTAVSFIGMPEGRIPLAQTVVHLATAPKSNACYAAIGSAVDDIRRGLAGPVPFHLRDSSYSGSAKLGHGQGYVYSHDDPDGVVAQQYAPDAVDRRDYYQPTQRGAEAGMNERLGRLRAILRRR